MIRIALLSCLSACALAPVPAHASSLAYAVSEVDGSSAEVVLMDGPNFDLGRMNARHDGAWRLGEDVVAPSAGDQDDVRLRVKLRPNRAMGRVSVPF